MIGPILKAIRLFHTKTQRQLAQILGISPNFLCQIEKGNKRPPLIMLEKYREIYGFPLSFIFEMAEGKRAAGKARSQKCVLFMEWMKESGK